MLVTPYDAGVLGERIIKIYLDREAVILRCLNMGKEAF
jgi:hypothetical protein